MALISLNNLERFFNNLKTYISNALNSKANTSHTHSASDITDLTVDSALSNSSENPVQNKVVKNALDGKIPLSGTNALAGSIVPDTDNAYNFGDSTYGFASFYVNKLYLKGSTIFNLVDDNYICVGGATAQANGANLVLNGKNRSTSTGEFKLEARDGTNTRQLIGKPDGTLSWNGNIIPSGTSTYNLGGVSYQFAHLYVSKIAQGYLSSALYLYGGADYGNGGLLEVCGKNYGSGRIRLIPMVSDSVYHTLAANSDGTLTWDGQPIQTASDQRLKQQINQIDDKLLDAWEDVDLVQFKYNDAVDQKKDKARLHTGYVVQQIDDACKSHGVDISEYGLYCHEEYPQETEEVEVEQEDGTIKKETKVIREASEHYSLRYTEALIVECAYLRKCIKELKEEIKELKNK